MGGKKGRNNRGATDDNESSKDQQIAELTKQNEELNKKIDRLLELLAKEKEDGAEGKGAASAAAQKKKEEAQKAAEAKKQEEPARRPTRRRQRPLKQETRLIQKGKSSPSETGRNRRSS